MQIGRDLIVAVGVSRAPLPEGEGEHGLGLTYWHDILPHQVPAFDSGNPLVVVHANDHPERRPSQASAIVPDAAKARQTSWGSTAADGKRFCGWNQPVSLIRLELSPAYLRRIHTELMGERGESPVSHVFHARDFKILEMGEWLLDELRAERIGKQLYVESLTKTLGLYVLRYYAFSSAIPNHSEQLRALAPEVARAKEYMQTHLSDPISLADIARAANISPSHLTRLFKHATGQSPHQFLIRLRVDYAKELLQSKGQPISEVAVRSGFADQSHLNRYLKRHYGMTPKSILDKP